MIICPCCGFKFEGDLSVGCESCGARSVGPPLARPLQELPSYGRALFVGVTGALLLLTFTGSTVAALLERTPLALDFWAIVAAAETAAWRLKWLALPVIAIALWVGKVLCASIRRNPARFMGDSIAHGGLAASLLVALMIATFIGVTIPERLRQRERGIEAGYNAQLYTLHRAFLQYRARFETYPSSLADLKLLPDPDGSIAAALGGVDQMGYKPYAIQARLPEKKSRPRRPLAVRQVSTNAGSAISSTDDALEEGVSFTNYDMILPGEDKILGTADDWRIRDGVITKPNDLPSATAEVSTP